jgi:hypothetical protein
MANLSSWTSQCVAILAHAVLAGCTWLTGNLRTRIVAVAFGVAQLTGRTGIRYTGSPQAEAVLANSVRTAWIFHLRTKRNTFPTQTDRALATIGVVVDKAIAVVVLAITDLR